MMKKYIQITIFILSCLPTILTAAPKSTTSTETSTQGITSDESSQAKQIDELMSVTGVTDSLQQLPDQIVQNVLRTNSNNAPLTPAQSELVRTINDAYPHNGFIDAAKAVLNKNYDKTRYSKLIETFSSPLAKRIVALESQQPSPEILRAYLAEIAKNPPTATRVSLIRKMDSTIGASNLFARISVTTIETMALASVEDCPDLKTKIHKTVAAQTKSIEKATQASTLLGLAFTYRDVSDSDLSAYINIYRERDSLWFQKILKDVILAQFMAGAEKMAEGVSKLSKLARANQSMFTPKCGESRPVNTTEAEPQKIEPIKQVDHVKSVKQKFSGDPRTCLDLNSDQEIMSCAERYR
ncbi:MAG TPA: hypothetical protein VIE91_07395 [Methylophilaceae bacterium]|jgi:hypothetical protein